MILVFLCYKALALLLYSPILGGRFKFCKNVDGLPWLTSTGSPAPDKRPSIFYWTRAGRTSIFVRVRFERLTLKTSAFESFYEIKRNVKNRLENLPSQISKEQACFTFPLRILITPIKQRVCFSVR